MAQDDVPPFRTPALGRWIARVFVRVGAGARAFATSVREAASARAGLIALRLLVWPIRHHVLLLAAIAVLVFGGLWWALVGDMRALLSGAARAALDAEGDEVRAAAWLIAAGAAALVALASAPFALLKAWVNERATRTAEDRHLTERIMRAVEQLGAEKTVKRVVETEEIVKGARVRKAETLETTEPNIEVRLGAIYALERIAQDSERDHIPIMETLCAYVRENSNVRAPRSLNLAEWEPLPDDADDAAKARHEAERGVRMGAYLGNATEWARSLPAPRADVQAALTVIGRRAALRRAHEAARGYRLDLGKANLQRADLSRLALERAQLSEARMEGANLSGARMEGANLSGARMEGAVLRGATLKSADLAFWNNARTNARSADFTGASNMTQDHVNALFGDRTTILPDYPPPHTLRRTDLMDREPLEPPWRPDPEYQAWLAAGAPPGKPLD